METDIDMFTGIDILTKLLLVISGGASELVLVGSIGTLDVELGSGHTVVQVSAAKKLACDPEKNAQITRNRAAADIFALLGTR